MLLTRVITAAVLVAALLAALLLLDRESFRFIVAAIVVLGAWEWGRLSGLRHAPAVAGFAVMCLGAYFYVLAAPDLYGPVLWVAALFWALVAPAWLSRGLPPGPALLLPATGLIVLVPAAAAMASLAPRLLLALVGLSVVADTAAYFSGRAFGRHKLAPAISPGKTWEGALGGAAGCLMYATICAMLMPEIGSRVGGMGWVVFLCGIMVLCAASILGDLFESALKRRAGAKDSGRLLPGHGGVLDRIDSATATLPLGMLMMRGAGIA